MGKASSSKKVARAARAGGRTSSRQRRGLLFPSILTLIMVLGVSLVVYARNDRNQEDVGGPPQLEDHFHQAIAINVCGEELATVPEWEPSPTGIHTHGDGVIHLHPFSELAVGANATLGRFMKSARDEGNLDFSISDDKLEYLEETYEEDETDCDGVDDPVLRMGYWSNVQDEESLPEVTTGDFADKRLTENGAGITLYYGDPDGDIPKPSNASQLEALGAADGGDPTPTTEGDGSTTTTEPGATTTAPGATSTTGPPDDTTAEPGATTTAAP